MAKKPSTVQKTDIEPQVGGISLPITFITAADVAPEWDLADRDAFLRRFWKQFGNDMLQSVLATVVAKVQTQNWELEGPKRLVKMYHSILRDESDFYRGYDSLISRGLQDYYTQDNGWFIERQRSGKRDKKGPALGFSHLDSYRMRPTGNNEYPYTYEDVYGAYHLMHRSQFIRIVDLPSPETQLYHHQKGFCALSRTLSTAMILTMIVAMKREKLADLPPSALAIFNNVSRKQFENALRLQGAHDDMKDNMIWRQLLPLFGVDPAHPAGVQFLSLREVWEGYSDQTAYDIAAYSFAAGFRIDPREFWPVSQGPLGTGKEAEVQHQKAKGKGHGLIFTAMERQLNATDSLPARVHFKFSIQDIDEEEQRSSIHAMQIGNIEGMQKAGAGLTAPEVRYLLCSQYKVLPKSLMRVPEEGQEPNLVLADVYMDDVERQAKEFGGFYFGPVVIMENNGRIHEPIFDQAFKELANGPLYIGDKVPPMVIMQKGGAGSGNWGHTGRPGMVGGSGGRGVAPIPVQGKRPIEFRDKSQVSESGIFDNQDDIGLTRGEKGSVGEYVESSYEVVNPYLRGIDVLEDDVDMKDYVQQEIQMLDKALSKAPELSQSLVVYRRMDDFELTAGTEFTDEAYVSTTYMRSSRGVFDPAALTPEVIARIVLPAGTKGLSIPNLLGHDPFDENEYLLPRGSTFKIVSESISGGTRRLDMELILNA